MNHDLILLAEQYVILEAYQDFKNRAIKILKSNGIEYPNQIISNIERGIDNLRSDVANDLQYRIKDDHIVGLSLFYLIQPNIENLLDEYQIYI